MQYFPEMGRYMVVCWERRNFKMFICWKSGDLTYLCVGKGVQYVCVLEEELNICVLEGSLTCMLGKGGVSHIYVLKGGRFKDFICL